MRSVRKLKNYILPKPSKVAEERKEPIPDEIRELMKEMVDMVAMRIEQEEEEGHLIYYDFQVDKIECTGLKNVELMGDNDPFVV